MEISNVSFSICYFSSKSSFQTFVFFSIYLWFEDLLFTFDYNQLKKISFALFLVVTKKLTSCSANRHFLKNKWFCYFLPKSRFQTLFFLHSKNLCIKPDSEQPKELPVAHLFIVPKKIHSMEEARHLKKKNILPFLDPSRDFKRKNLRKITITDNDFNIDIQ